MLFRRLFSKFGGDRGGNVAPIFALAMIPVIGFVGAAVDYSRAASARTSLQGALDATALFLSKEAQGLSQEQVQAKGQEYFNSIFHDPEAKNVQVTTQFIGEAGDYTVRVSATADVNTRIIRVIGPENVPISASSDVVWGMKRLEIALVLDSTGSMGSQNRMVELKKATKSLLTTLENAATNSGKPDAVKIAIVPFAAQVNVGTGNVSAFWLDWTAWEEQAPAAVSWIGSNATTWARTGPGSSCPFTTGTHGFRCSDGPASRSNDGTINNIPSSGSNNGLICPSRHTGSGIYIGRYYNGCYNSVEKPSSQWYTVATGTLASCGSNPNCSCSGSGSNRKCIQKTYNHTWVVNPKSTWDGCVRDREQNYDVQDTTPSSTATNYQPFQNYYCPSVAVLPMTSNWTTLSNTVDAFDSLGATNITIGLAWGMHALTSTEPMTSATPDPQPDDLDKVIIMMSDGDNTLNRWSGNGSSYCANCDARTALACTNAKAMGFKIYSIRLMDGNEDLLRNCATEPGMYFNVETASELNTVFTAIAKNLASLRIFK